MWSLFIILNCLGACSASPTLTVVQGFSSQKTCIAYSKEVESMYHNNEEFVFKCIAVK